MFIGYAIIQLPDFLLILYERLKSIKWCQNVQNTNTTEIGVAPITILMARAPNQTQNEEDANSVKNRFSKLEENNIDMCRNLAEMRVAMEEMRVTITNHIKTD